MLQSRAADGVKIQSPLKHSYTCFLHVLHVETTMAHHEDVTFAVSYVFSNCLGVANLRNSADSYNYREERTENEVKTRDNLG